MNRTNHSPAPTRRANWRGLRLAGFGLVLFALSAFGAGCATANHKDQEEEATLTTLPQEVRNGLDRATINSPPPLAGARWTRIVRLGGTDDSHYQLRGTNWRGRVIELEVTRAGRVIEVEEFGVPLAEVPAPAIEGLKTRIPYANPDWIVAIYQAGNFLPLSYGFGGRNARGETVEVYITADGKTFLN